MQLHLHNMRKLNKTSFVHVVGDVYTIYGNILTNFMAEATTWYNIWKNEGPLMNSKNPCSMLICFAKFHSSIQDWPDVSGIHMFY